MPNLVSPTGQDIHLRAVRGNSGIKMAYRRKLKRLIMEMQASVEYWLRAAYKRNLPRIAQDDNPTTQLRDALKKLRKQWEGNFAVRANKLATWFANKTLDYADGSLMKGLEEVGFAVEFKMTQPMHDAYTAVIQEQVGLIKSIPEHYLNEVEGMVMRSVQQGRNLDWISKELRKRYAITKRRAELISRDQNNKATAVITRVRQKEIGITEAIWRHSSAGKEPRPSHVAANGKRYDVDKGMYIDGEWIFPGEKINCRCTSRSVIPGFND